MDFILSFDMVDAYGLTKMVRVPMTDYAEVDLGLTMSQVLSDAEGVVEAYEAASGAKSVNFKLSVLNLDGLAAFFAPTVKANPVALSDVTDWAVISAALQQLVPGLQTKGIINIPAPADAILVAPGVSHDIDPTATPLTDLVAVYGPTAGGEPTLSDGQNTDPTAGPFGNGVLGARWTSRKRSV